MDFAYLKDRADYFLKNREFCLSSDGKRDLICRSCDFWKEDERDYQCAGYAILCLLLDKGMITPEQIVDAVKE